MSRRYRISSALLVSITMILLILESGAKAETTITILLYGGRHQHPEEVWEAYDRWIAKEVPGVKVKWIYEQRGKLDVMLAGGAGPDMWEVYVGPDILKYAKNGAALDLTSFFGRGIVIPKDDWFQPALEAWTVDGKIYGVPGGLGHFGNMVYNRALFDEMGLQEPTLSWTTADLENAARKLTRDLNGDGTIDVWGVGGFERLWTLIQFVWAGGGDVLAPDKKKSALGSFESRRVLEWIVNMAETSLTDPIHDIWQSNFMKAKTGMHVGVSPGWYGGFYSYAQKGLNVREDVAQVLLPLDVKTRKRQLMVDTGGFMINAASPNKEIAWKVLCTLVRHGLEVTKMKRAQAVIPALRSQQATVFGDLSFFDGDRNTRDLLFEATKHLRPFIWPNAELESLFGQEWAKTYGLKQPVSSMIANLEKLVPTLATK